MEQRHYMCTGGCNGMSQTPGTCQTESCPKHTQPLTECNCTDGMHEENGTKDKE